MVDAVIRSTQGGLTILQLSRPENRNALTSEMKEALAANTLEFFDNPEERCLLITGTESAFCAGGDLRTLTGGSSPSETHRRMEGSHVWARRLLSGRKPVITAVNGVASGAGFALALMGDIILAADDAYFLAGFAGVGVAADLALALTLPRAVGVPRAKDILLSNRRVDATEAANIGLVSRAIPKSKLMEQAIELGQRLAVGPTFALGQTKRLVGLSFEQPLDSFLESELAAQTACFASADCIEGVNAFFSKRKPQFTGHEF